MKNENIASYLRFYPQYTEVYNEFKSGVFADIKGRITHTLTNGDIVRTVDGRTCIVEIQGYAGSYHHIDGKLVNLATGTDCYFRDLETGVANRMNIKSIRRLRKARTS